MPITKGSVTPHSICYQPISITPELSKVFVEYVERVGVVNNPQYTYRKNIGASNALLDNCCARQDASQFLQLDFSR